MTLVVDLAVPRTAVPLRDDHAGRGGNLIGPNGAAGPRCSARSRGWSPAREKSSSTDSRGRSLGPGPRTVSRASPSRTAALPACVGPRERAFGPRNRGSPASRPNGRRRSRSTGSASVTSPPADRASSPGVTAQRVSIARGLTTQPRLLCSTSRSPARHRRRRLISGRDSSPPRGVRRSHAAGHPDHRRAHARRHRLVLDEVGWHSRAPSPRWRRQPTTEHVARWSGSTCWPATGGSCRSAPGRSPCR